MDVNSAQNAIQSSFPDFEITSIEIIGEGMDSVAFEINKKYIFRFPKKELAKNNLKKEIAILPRLQNMLYVQIPSFLFIDKETRFVGYKKIEGVDLEKYYPSLDDAGKNNVARELSKFIEQLHKFPLEQAISCGLEAEHPLQKYTKNYEDIKITLFPLIDKKLQNIITRDYSTFLENSKLKDTVLSVIHGDFSPEHVFYDTEMKRISGIIDFGDIRIGDPDDDLRWWCIAYGDNFLNAMLRHLPHPNKKWLKEKLLFYAKANWLYDATEGIKIKDNSLFKNSIEKYRKL